MLDACNRIDSMDKMIQLIEETKTKNKDHYNQILIYITNVSQNGHLEPENYDALMRGPLGQGFESDYQKAFDLDAPKMVSYLSALRQKLDEYSKVSG